jgi:hypothetical protein
MKIPVPTERVTADTEVTESQGSMLPSVLR